MTNKLKKCTHIKTQERFGVQGNGAAWQGVWGGVGNGDILLEMGEMRKIGRVEREGG